MRITARQLRQVIREELQRNLLREEESEFVRGTLAPMTLGSFVAGQEVRGLSDINLQKLVDFLAGVLAGEIVVDAGRNNIDQNLMISLIIAAYVKTHARDLADDPVFLSHVATTYSDELIRKLQSKLNLQVDGDFGRQTLVALVSNGRYILDPTSRSMLKGSSQLRKRLAFRIASGAKGGRLDVTPDELKSIIFGTTPDMTTAAGTGYKSAADTDDTDVSVDMTSISDPPPVRTSSPVVPVKRLPMPESSTRRRR